MAKQKFYVITRLCKEDIIQAFKDIGYTPAKMKRIRKAVDKMTDAEMEYLASKLADDYCNQLFWDSLRIIFNDKFLEVN